MNGPYESPADVQKIINTLTEKSGVNGFNTLYRLIDDVDDDEFI